VRTVAVLAPAVLSVAVLALVDPHIDVAPPASASAGQTARSERVDAPRRIRDRARAPRPAPPTDGWRRGPRGFATYYAQMLDGRETASGTIFDNDDLVAAHPRYPFGTTVRVTNLSNGRKVVVTIVDRGPVRSARANGVIIDLSRAAAERLDFIDEGRTRVRLESREPADTDDAITPGSEG
jgi:rare lipoprotein A